MTSWIGLVALSAVLVALANIIRKHVLARDHPLEQLAAEAPFRLLVILAFIPFVTIPPLWQLLVIFLISLVLLTTHLFRNRAYRHMPISVIAPLHNLSPVVLLFLAVPLLGEQPTATQMLGVAFVVIGGYVLELRGKNPLSPLRSMSRNQYAGVIMMLLVLLSALALADKAMVSRAGIDIITYIFWLHLFFAIMSFSSEFVLYRASGVWEDMKTQGGWLLAIIVLSLTSIFAFFSGIAHPEALIVLAIPIRRTATLIETVVGGSLFHEDGVWRKALACLIMLGGVALIA